MKKEDVTYPKCWKPSTSVKDDRNEKEKLWVSTIIQ